jgi:Iap family predicted aminopeptidase
VELLRDLRTVAATDALIALRAGYPTCTLGGVDDTKFPSNYHWPSDVPDNLDWSSIEGAADVCLRYVSG